MADHGAVLVISSHVARGSVGNRSAVFALERLGHTVWAVPSILLPHHPGHGAAPGIVPTDSHFAAFLESLAEAAGRTRIAAILSGYLASPGQATAVATLVRAVRSASPQALYLCDPVIGDHGRLYVAEAVAVAIRDALLPLADFATPNAFECAWLAGAAAGADLAGLARALPPPSVLVTSAPALMRDQIGNLLVEPRALTLLEHARMDTTAKGTGDLLAALLVARRLEGLPWADAAALSLSSVFEIVSGTARAGAEDLLFPALQAAMVQPRAHIGIRRLPLAPAVSR